MAWAAAAIVRRMAADARMRFSMRGPFVVCRLRRSKSLAPFLCCAASGNWLLRQRHADQFLIVAGEHALLGEGGMAPYDVALECLAGRLVHVPAADLVVTLGAELGDDE